ncbi:MAG: hypothetical protein ACP5NV_02495, partial [Candidatus Woesearchaeota archaeon]
MRKNNTRFNNNRKSQITIFVILGIILVVTIALLFYLKSASLKIKPPVENLEINDQAKPVQSYIIDCLKSNSKEALLKIGQNGGYIDVSEMKISAYPYDSDAFVFEPQILPYWYYIRSCRESQIGCVDSLRPALCDESDDCVINSQGDGSIEEQLSNYIELNIEKCTDLSIFEDEFEIKRGKIDVTTIIKQDEVEFRMN